MTTESLPRTTLPPWVAVAILSCAVGVGIGFLVRTLMPEPAAPASPPSAGPTPVQLPGGPRPASPGGGGGAGAENANARALYRTVTGLDALQTAQGKALSADQQQKLRPVLANVGKEEPLTEEKAGSYLKEIQSVLNERQRAAADSIGGPPRGGGGGGGGQGGGGGGLPPPPGFRPPGGSSGVAGSGAPGSGGRGGSSGAMSGGNRIDWEHPFHEGPGKERLERLLGGH
jgi:hypothetical protein